MSKNGKGSSLPVDVVAPTELIPEQGMDSRPLPMESKLPVSLANVFASKFTVSLKYEHVGTAQGGSPLQVYAVSPTDLRSEGLPFQ